MNKSIIFFFLSFLFTSCISVTPIEPNTQNVHKFFAAVKKGNIDKVDEYLDAGFSVDVRNHKEFGGKTALMVASKRMNPEMVEFLIKKGADVNAFDRYNNTAISEASRVNKKGVARKVVSLLIDSGAKIDPIVIKGEKLPTKSPLIHAIEQSNSEVVDLLLEKNATLCFNEKDIIYFSPLDTAIERFNNETAKKIIVRSACEDPKIAFSALQTAVKCGNIEIIETLIESGVDPNFAFEDNMPPILAASVGDKPKILEYLIKKGARTDYKDEGGNSLLHYVSRYGKLRPVETLLNNGIDINIRNDMGETPLMMANMSQIKLGSMLGNFDFDMPDPNESKEKKQKRLNKKLAENLKTVERFDDAEILKFLIKKGADVNARDNGGKSVLMHMVSEGMIKSVEELIKSKADVNAKDNDENAVLAYAGGEPYRKIHDLLVKHGAKPDEYMKDGIAMELNHTPLVMPALFTARAGKGRYGALKKMSEEERKEQERIYKLQVELFEAAANGDNDKIKSVLKEEAIDINKTDNSRLRKTPLFHAIENSHISTAELLLDNGADINTERAHGITPLFEAVKTDNHEMVRMLLEKGANVIAFDADSAGLSKGEYKKTPFMETIIESEDYKIAELLLEYGGDVNAEVDHESSLLASAAYGFNSELVGFLLINGAVLDAEDDFTVSLISLIMSKSDRIDINVRNEAGMNLFHYAVMNGEIEIADELLEKGLDINSTLRNGNNALGLAMMDIIKNDDFSTVKWLIEKGIDVKNRNREGKSCVELADDLIQKMENKMRFLCKTPENEKPFRKEITKIEKLKKILKQAEKK